VVFRFQESPKFLLYRGKDEKAVKVLQHLAKFNGRETSISLEIFEALDKDEGSIISSDTTTPITDREVEPLKRTWKEKVKLEFVRYKTLFATPTLARLTILIWIVCKQSFELSSQTWTENYTPGSIAGVQNCALRLHDSENIVKKQS